MIFLSFMFCITLFAFNALVVGESQWLFQSEKKWDKEWSSGAWSYLESISVERARVAVIGGVFCQKFVSLNASVLDVGCGEGAISDFLTQGQRLHYVGVDISKEAVAVAKNKRGPPLKFVHAAAHHFQPHLKFDVIIFSDVLYYVEHEKVLDQYAQYMTPSGILIISIFHQTEKLMYEHIFNYARNKFSLIDEIDISGNTKKSSAGPLEKTAFRIEVYKLKS